jgi:hypothetical protein
MPPTRGRLDGGQHFQDADPGHDIGQAQGRTQPSCPLLLPQVTLLVMAVVMVLIVVVALAGQDVGLKLGMGVMGGLRRRCEAGEGREEGRRRKD